MTSDSVEEKRDITEHWDWASEGYQDRDIDFDSVGYGSGVTEEELGLLDDVEDEDVLEVGCGGAEISIALAKRGANCTGIDISREQLRTARHRVTEHGVDVELIKGDIENMAIASETQDIAISVHAFQWAQNTEAVYREAYRVLKNGGLLVYSATHPFFNCLSREEDRLAIEHTYYRNKTEGVGHNEGLILNHPTISDALNWLLETGFSIEQVEEPNPNENPVGGNEDELTTSIPPLIVYKARK